MIIQILILLLNIFVNENVRPEIRIIALDLAKCIDDRIELMIAHGPADKRAELTEEFLQATYNVDLMKETWHQYMIGTDPKDCINEARFTLNIKRLRQRYASLP